MLWQHHVHPILVTDMPTSVGLVAAMGCLQDPRKEMITYVEYEVYL